MPMLRGCCSPHKNTIFWISQELLSRSIRGFLVCHSPGKLPNAGCSPLEPTEHSAMPCCLANCALDVEDITRLRRSSALTSSSRHSPNYPVQLQLQSTSSGSSGANWVEINGVTMSGDGSNSSGKLGGWRTTGRLDELERTTPVGTVPHCWIRRSRGAEPEFEHGSVGNLFL